MIGGIQAGRVDELSAKSVFPALLRAAQQRGSLMKHLRPATGAMPGPQANAVAGPVFRTLTTGVGSFISTLASTLEQRGVILRTASPATMVRRTPTDVYPWTVDTETTTTPATTVVLATSAAVTSRLVGSHSPDLAALAQIPTAGAAMVTLQFDRRDLVLPATGTGILIPLNTPYGEDFYLTTAVTFLDRKWAHLRREEDIVLRVHVGRSDDRRWSALSDEALRERIVAELSTFLDVSGSPMDSVVQRWPEGLPQYLLGHEQLATRAASAAQALGLVLVGNAYDGVGVPASIGSGRAGGVAARTMLA
jgi:oxygen-dependent protoporphyrinogen oxidase